MKKLFLLCYIFLVFQTSFAQFYDTRIAYVPHVYPLNNLSWSGYSTLAGDISNITTINPAAAINFNKTSFGLSFLFETKMDNVWFGSGNKRIKPGIPQSAGIILPYKNLRLSAGMDQYYNLKLDMGKIPATNVNNPYGTGEYLEPVYETNIYRYSLGAAYMLKDLFAENSSLALGVRINYNFIKEYELLDNIKTDETMSAYTFSAGLIYNAEGESGKMQAGISYESGIDESKLYNIEIIRYYTGNHDYIGEFETRRLLSCKTPESINAGIVLDNNKGMSITGSLFYIFRDEDPYYNSEPRVSASFIYDFSEVTQASAGFMYSSITRDQNDSPSDWGNNMSAFYFTAGVNLNLPYFNISASLADSHLTGGDWRKHTIIKLGLNYSLQ